MKIEPFKYQEENYTFEEIFSSGKLNFDHENRVRRGHEISKYGYFYSSIKDRKNEEDS